MGKQIFAMQGPFDTQMNCALIRHAGACWLLTKETGAAGGFPEKMEAVRQCGIRAVVVCAPSAGSGESCPQDSAFGEAAVTKQDSLIPVNIISKNMYNPKVNINPNNPTLVPICVIRKIPINAITDTQATFFLVFSTFFINGNIINIDNTNIALKLLPDSNQPLAPICSTGYVYDEVPVNIDI